MSKKLKPIVLAVGAIVAALIGFGLLFALINPGAVQGQDRWPTVPPPDFGAFATSFCCDDGTPKYMTPSVEQITLWTEVAQTQVAMIQPDAPTVTPLPPIEYLAPSGEWATYKDPTYGYSFEYPANWYLVEEIVGTQKGVAIVNSSPTQVDVKGAESPRSDKIKIVVFPSDDMGTYNSLTDYVNDPKRFLPGQEILSSKAGTSINGYQLLWKKEILTGTFL
ncbi:MAG: hypothetical protein HYZ35_03750, partial [Chloroflexi bacterium]|nr:hypothetical protein [Chloroflexota bacterium]